MHTLAKFILLALFSLAACSSDADEVAPDAQAAAPDAGSSDTWDSFALGFFTSYCHDCHGPGDALRDYALLETVQGEANKIQCGVSTVILDNCSIAPRMFPIGNGAMPSDAERMRLVQWIAAGADAP